MGMNPGGNVEILAVIVTLVPLLVLLLVLYLLASTNAAVKRIEDRLGKLAERPETSPGQNT